MPFWLKIAILVVAALAALEAFSWVLGHFVRFAAGGYRAFRDSSVKSSRKHLSIGLHVAGVLLLAGGVLALMWLDFNPLHFFVAGPIFLAGGIWLMSINHRRLPRFMKVSAVVEFVLGVVVMAIGFSHELLWTQYPVLGTATAAELFTLGGAIVAFAGLFALAPGGPGGPPGSGGFGGGDGGGGG